MRLLERDELVVEAVVLGVRDLGLVEDVVLVEVVVEQLLQLGRPLGRSRRPRGRQGAPPGGRPARRAPPARAGRGGGSRPRSTPTESMPAALAAAMSNGESPTYAASSARRRAARAREQPAGRACALGDVVAADDDLEESPSGRSSNVSSTVMRRLTVTTPSLRSSSLQPLEHGVDTGEEPDVPVERLVVRAVGRDQLVDAVRVERRHLPVEAGPADAAPSARRPRSRVRARFGRVVDRGEDGRAGVDRACRRGRRGRAGTASGPS